MYQTPKKNNLIKNTNSIIQCKCQLTANQPQAIGNCIADVQVGEIRFSNPFPKKISKFSFFNLILACGETCTCGGECTCGLGGDCAMHGSQNAYYDQSYMLPVRYDMPASRPRRGLSNRQHRQTKLLDFDAIAGHFKDRHAKTTEVFRSTADSMRDRFSTIVSSIPLAEHFQPLISSTKEFIEGFPKNFPGLRKRRSVDEKEEMPEQDDDRRIPMLRVREKDEKPCETIENLKQLSNKQAELKSPDAVQYIPELQQNQEKEWEGYRQCHLCGSQLTGNVCQMCGHEHTYQPPQYVEYVQGKPISFYPGACQTPAQSTPRYVYDRYGHKYLENNGNLRLLMPHHQEAIVGSQSDFAGLPDILRYIKKYLYLCS